MNARLLRVSLILAALTIFALMSGCAGPSADVELVNVSYDPTRELYQEINAAFAAHYEATTGQTIKVTQSHGGSGSQARAVIDGLQGDVVTLALAGDVEAIRKRGLIHEGWQGRLPDDSCPYTSTIVFVVRPGNPKNIRDWPDLVRPDVKVITPNPKTSGGARWNFLAAWGYVAVHQKRPEGEARDFIRRLYGNVPKLDTGARGATDTFLHRNQGDVLIAWENEALLASKEARGEERVQLVRPSVSIRAEPPVAVVDRYTDERGTRAAAEAYLEFLYTEPAQDIIGKHGYRPRSPAAQAKYADALPALPMFTLREVAGDWDTADQKFFGDGGVFDQIYDAKERR